MAGVVVGFLLLAGGILSVVMIIIFLQWRKKKGMKNIIASKYVLATLLLLHLSHIYQWQVMMLVYFKMFFTFSPGLNGIEGFDEARLGADYSI